MSRFDLKREGGLIDDAARTSAFKIVQEAFNTHDGLSQDIHKISTRMVMVPSLRYKMLWHEQRHFVDHLLTNLAHTGLELETVL